jgi:hypothetical protein
MTRIVLIGDVYLRAKDPYLEVKDQIQFRGCRFIELYSATDTKLITVNVDNILYIEEL